MTTRDDGGPDGSNPPMETHAGRLSALSIIPIAVPGLPGELGLSLVGKLGHDEVAALERVFRALLDGGARYLVLDIARVHHVCSTPLGHLVKLADTLIKRGGGLALVGAAPKVKLVFEMLGLEAFFLLCATLDDAARLLPRHAETLEANRALRAEQAARSRAQAEAQAKARKAAALEAADAALVALTSAGPGWLGRLRDAWSGGGAVSARVRTLEEPTRTWCLELDGPFDERAPACLLYTSPSPRD